jgi:hypothetical protein
LTAYNADAADRLDVVERERIRAALREKHLPAVAALACELGVDTLAIEAFAHDHANIAPGLLAGLARILARSRPKPVTAPGALRNIMKPLNAKVLKCTIPLVWGCVCQGSITPFLSSFVIPFFCSTCAASILSSRPHICIAVARSGGQGRRFFSAAEGLSLTDASTAAGY